MPKQEDCIECGKAFVHYARLVVRTFHARGLASYTSPPYSWFCNEHGGYTALLTLREDTARTVRE